jgi:hypothetical protein
MSRHFQVAHRRVAVLAAAVLGTSSLVAVGLAGTAFAEDSGGGPPTVADTPCTATARACVDLEDQKAWLIQDGKVIRGPVPISSGGPGKETPPGTFHVISKDKDHKSNEFKLPNGQPAPMPWSVFFQWSGIAFHSGDPERASAGCVHLPEPDAIAWFNYLRVGNEVQVHGGGDHGGGDHGGDDHNGDDHGDSGDDHGDSGDDHHGDDHGDAHGDHGGDDHGGDDHGGDDSGH